MASICSGGHRQTAAAAFDSRCVGLPRYWQHGMHIPRGTSQRCGFLLVPAKAWRSKSAGPGSGPSSGEPKIRDRRTCDGLSLQCALHAAPPSPWLTTALKFRSESLKIPFSGPGKTRVATHVRVPRARGPGVAHQKAPPGPRLRPRRRTRPWALTEAQRYPAPARHRGPDAGWLVSTQTGLPPHAPRRPRPTKETEAGRRTRRARATIRPCVCVHPLA